MTMLAIAKGISLAAETLPAFLSAIGVVQSSFDLFQNKQITKDELLKRWHDAGVKVQSADKNLQNAMDEALRGYVEPNPNTLTTRPSV